MKVLVIFIFTSLLLANISFAQSINSEFKLSSGYSNLKEGDIFEATIRFWPIENADLEFFRNLDKKILFNSFYMTEIISLGSSVNNADVIELKAIFLAQSASPQQVHTFDYKSSLIEVDLGQIKVEPLKEKTSEFIILEQQLTQKSIWQILLGLFIIFLIAIYLKRDKLRDFIARIRHADEKRIKEKFKKIFQAASVREDYEQVYKDKEKWLKHIPILTPAHRDFFNVINAHQYKRSWSSEELNGVRSSFEVIKGSFDK